MKNTQKCPRCGSSEITSTAKLSLRWRYVNISFFEFLSEFKLIDYVTRYRCVECSHYEDWLDEEEDIQYLDDDEFPPPPWKKNFHF